MIYIQLFKKVRASFRITLINVKWGNSIDYRLRATEVFYQCQSPDVDHCPHGDEEKPYFRKHILHYLRFYMMSPVYSQTDEKNISR